METGAKELKKAFTWEIENLASENDVLYSDPFSSGGCEWYLMVYPKGAYGCNHLSVYLSVSNAKSLSLGWKRRASYYFVLLNQSGKEITRISESSNLYCHETSGWGYSRMLTRSKIREEGFLEKNKLTIEVYIKVVEVVHQGKSTENDMVSCCRFQMVASQAITIAKIYTLHPDFAKDIRPKNKEVETAYINLLFGLITTLEKPSKSLSESELRKADSELTVLMEVGFKLDWLKSKLEEVSLERKKADDADGSLVQQHEERIKNLEPMVSDLKVETDKDKIIYAVAPKVSSFGYIINRLFLSCFSISKY